MNGLAAVDREISILVALVLGSGVLSAFLLRRLLRAGPPPIASSTSISGAPDRVAIELTFIALVGLVLRGLLVPLLLRGFGGLGLDLDDVDRDLATSLAANGAIVAFAAIYAYRHARTLRYGLCLDGSKRATLGFEVLLAILGLAAIAPFFVASSQLNDALLQRLGAPAHQEMVTRLIAAKDKLHDVWIVLGIGIAIPFLEEVLFRGLVLRGLSEALRPAPAVLASAMFFAIMHDAPARVPVFVLGLLFGLLYLRTRSIFASFVAHALFNTAQLLIFIPRSD